MLFFRLFTIVSGCQDKHLLVTFGGERICQENVVETLSDIQVLDTQLFIAYPPGMVSPNIASIIFFYALLYVSKALSYCTSTPLVRNLKTVLFITEWEDSFCKVWPHTYSRSQWLRPCVVWRNQWAKVGWLCR